MAEKFYHEMSTLELLKAYIVSKLPKGKQKLVEQQTRLNNQPPKEIVINHIAIVIDGIVEEVLRCENRLAALLLSNSEFVEFDPEKEYPTISLTRYENGEFVTPKVEDEDLLREEEIQNILENLENKDD